MSSRGIIIYLAGFMAIAAIAFANIFRMNTFAVSNVTKTYYYKMANNLAQSGVNMALRQLRETPTWRTGFTNLSAFSGKITVKLKDSTYNGSNIVKITSIGITDSVRDDWGKNNKLSIIRDTTTVFVKISTGFIPAAVKAAITTNNNIETKGALIVDGRDHSLAGALIAGSGTLGIWTTQNLDQGGSSDIGGTFSAVDYAPNKPGNANIIKESQVWPGGYPSTPDGILGGSAKGYPEGTLKTISQNGQNGSQYVTNPASLTTPLSGITYVELPNDGTWQSMDITGTGILIVHNSYGNAKMKNLNSGTFKGLIIVDDVLHIHSNIIGALVGLTGSPSAGNCIGNGNGSVKYSSAAVKTATEKATVTTGSGSAENVVLYIE